MPAAVDKPNAVKAPAAGAAPATPAAPVAVKITPERLEVCRESARFWAVHLGPYADSMQALSDRYAITASVLSAITGLTIWGTIATTTTWWGQLITGAMAIAAAVVAIVPKVKGYGECALKAAPLATEYGKSEGQLMDAGYAVQTDAPHAQEAAHEAITHFEAIRERKEALRPFPRQLALKRHPTA